MHLQAKKLKVTVYTSDEYEAPDSDDSDAKEFTHVDVADTAEEKGAETGEGAKPPDSEKP